MRINELFKVRYNNTLNPSIWDGNAMRPEVYKKLMDIADAFVDFIDVDDMSIHDIILTGSNANYNWTEMSDIDLHLVVDMVEFRDRCPEFVDDYFNDKKTLWNEHHDIEIYDHPVEVYVQPSDQEHVSTGQYSLSSQKWLIYPEYKPPKINDNAVLVKAQQYAYEIDELINAHAGEDVVDSMKDKIKRMRQTGLSRGGEFSTENLTFKDLRSRGYIDKLYSYSRFLGKKKYSLDKDLL